VIKLHISKLNKEKRKIYRYKAKSGEMKYRVVWRDDTSEGQTLYVEHVTNKEFEVLVMHMETDIITIIEWPQFPPKGKK
jgi:hypothetical protein